MITPNIKSPGVYIQEVNAFPNSVVGVATSVPVFIGYTPQALYQGKSYTNVAQKITSFADFEAIYCNVAQKAYSPQYYLSAVKDKPASGNYLQLGGGDYALSPDPNSIYYLYNAIRLFYANGGGNAYIVSVGGYGALSGKPTLLGNQIVNPNIKLGDLLIGLGLLKNEEEPTMYICPDATLLSVADNATLMQAMLSQCEEMQTAISILDIIGADAPDPVTFLGDINTFRDNLGSNGLNYGAAYYPFVGTTITSSSEINYTNLFGGDIAQLAPLLKEPAVEAVITNIKNPSSGLTELQNNNALLIASPTYTAIMQHVLNAVNLLPPSAGMAGIITTTDNEVGPWEAPANRAIVGVNSLPIKLSDTQQASLNIDAVDGKSVNAIRYFNGQGILVWGARTLDGNSQDWKYLSVRRTMIYIEQSCKLTARSYVFEPNNANTWASVKAMIRSFLTSLWKQGGLQGATPADAFSVDCGLGTTMTTSDLLNGFMNVSVRVSVVHPAEFIVITFQQQMAASS